MCLRHIRRSIGGLFMVSTWAVGAFCSMIAVHAPVSADELLVPPDPWQIVHIAREFGTADVRRDGMRDPLIEAEVEGVPYRISFYGCWLGRECKTILFSADLGRAEWTPEDGELASWNAKALFGRAWLREDGRAALDHPLAMADGLPQDSLRATFDAWRIALSGYRDFLDF